MEHYYSTQSDTAFNPQYIQHTIHKKLFKFMTSNAVFSKDSIDFGSHFLIQTLLDQGTLSGNLLDIGCGYGPIGIILAYFNESLNVDMVDVNERALKLAKINIENHALSSRVHAWASNGCEDVEKKYDIIVTNPPIRAGKQVIQAFYTGAYDKLKKNGALYVVIQKKQGAPSSKQFLEACFGHCEVIAKESGYFLLKSIKL